LVGGGIGDVAEHDAVELLKACCQVLMSRSDLIVSRSELIMARSDLIVALSKLIMARSDLIVALSELVDSLLEMDLIIDDNPKGVRNPVEVSGDSSKNLLRFAHTIAHLPDLRVVLGRRLEHEFLELLEVHGHRLFLL
jgi:hypothetical protein